jgi:hypothetical protein
MQWMNPHRIVRKTVEYKPIGRNDVGRLREDGRTIFKDSCLMGMDLMICLDSDDGDDDDIDYSSLLHLSFVKK